MAANVERIAHLPPDRHRAFYNSQRFTLNVTRADMVAAGYSPSVRLFEAAACGTPIISDAWPGLDELFEPDREILIAHDTDDVLALPARPGGRRAQTRRERARACAARTRAARARTSSCATCARRYRSRGHRGGRSIMDISADIARRVRELAPWFHNLDLDGRARPRPITSSATTRRQVAALRARAAGTISTA